MVIGHLVTIVLKHATVSRPTLKVVHTLTVNVNAKADFVVILVLKVGVLNPYYIIAVSVCVYV